MMTDLDTLRGRSNNSKIVKDLPCLKRQYIVKSRKRVGIGPCWQKRAAVWSRNLHERRWKKLRHEVNKLSSVGELSFSAIAPSYLN